MRRLKYISPFPLFSQRRHLGQRQDRVQVKLTISLLTFLFIMGPIWPALGQEIAQIPTLNNQVITTPLSIFQEAVPLEQLEMDNNSELIDNSDQGQFKDKENKDNIPKKDEEIDGIETMNMNNSMSAGNDSASQQNSGFRNSPKIPEADESTGA